MRWLSRPFEGVVRGVGTGAEAGWEPVGRGTWVDSGSLWDGTVWVESMGPSLGFVTSSKSILRHSTTNRCR